jgi:hypothetical protein
MDPLVLKLLETLKVRSDAVCPLQEAIDLAEQNIAIIEDQRREIADLKEQLDSLSAIVERLPPASR